MLPHNQDFWKKNREAEEDTRICVVMVRKYHTAVKTSSTQEQKSNKPYLRQWCPTFKAKRWSTTKPYFRLTFLICEYLLWGIKFSCQLSQLCQLKSEAQRQGSHPKRSSPVLQRDQQRPQTCLCPKGKAAQDDKHLLCQMAWQTLGMVLCLPLTYSGFHIPSSTPGLPPSPALPEGNSHLWSPLGRAADHKALDNWVIRALLSLILSLT